MNDLLNMKMGVKLEFINGSTSQINTIRKVIGEMEWAINQTDFRRFILNYRNGKGERKFLQTQMTNEQILREFVEGNERDKTVIDYEVDLKLKFYFKKFSKAIAYTNRGSIEINLNSKFLYRDIGAIANTLVHEYCHLVGMGHSYKNPGWNIWNQTAPYAIGNKVQEMIEEKLQISAPLPVRNLRPSRWVRFKRWLRRIF